MTIVWLILKWIFILVVALLIVGVIYEQYSRYSAKKNFVDNGTYVEVYGHKIHYVKQGTGSHTVIFESGLDFSAHLSWKEVQDEVSKVATTISYDRAGLLGSEETNRTRSCENMADELHELLEKTDMKKPYVLVVHSLGGLIARCYVKKYTNTLKGIVFVDASHLDQIEKAPESIKAKMRGDGVPTNWILNLADYTGFPRFSANKMIDKIYKDRDDLDAIKSEINFHLMKSQKGAIKEVRMLEHMTKEAKGINFGDIPLTILSAEHKNAKGNNRILFDFFLQLQKESLNLSTNSKQILVDSGHNIQVEKPKVVVDAIKEMIK